MAYSKSPFTLKKIEAQLEPLTRGQTCVYRRPESASPNWASLWSYKIREGLSIAKLYPEKFPALTKIASSVEVRVLSSQEVEASVTISVAPALFEITKTQLQTWPSITAPITSIEQIKADWTGHGSLHYPATSLGYNDIIALAQWSNAQSPLLMVLYSARTTSLTLAIDDPAVPAEAKVQP